jgi:aryl-alcohol dehydrogenase-like predicted oxidoreductase
MSMILGTSDIGHKLAFDAAVRLIERYWALGGREFDTAHTYAHWIPGQLGASERTLGAVLRALQLPLDQLQITTKGGHPDNGPLYPRPARYLDPALVTRDLDESLARLELPHVHAYLLHRDDATVPVRDVAALLGQIRASGRAAMVGVSNWPLARVRELRAALDGVLVWQNQASLCEPNWREQADPTMRRFTEADFVWAAANDVQCTCYSSTGNGYFAADVSGGTFDNPVSQVRRAAARALAAQLGVSANQVALAWLCAQPGDVRPIVGTTTLAHLEDAMAARALQLTAQQVTACAVNS